jgi:hypothetical protein
MSGAEIFIKENEIFIYTMNHNDLKKFRKILEELGIKGELRVIFCG